MHAHGPKPCPRLWHRRNNESFVAQKISFDKVEGINPKFKGLKPAPKKVFKAKKVVAEKHKPAVKKARVSNKKQENVFHESIDVGAAPMRRKKRVIIDDSED